MNERVAFEMAYGASLSGKRSVVTMKSVGINACADPFLHAMIAGVQGGFVIIVSDDTRVVGSQEREDSRHYIDFFGGLWLEPSTLQMAYDMAYDAFVLSENFDTPIVIRLTNQYFEQTGSYIRQKPVYGMCEVANNPKKFIVYPIYWRQQWDNLKVKQEHINQYVTSYYKNHKFTSGNDHGIIVVGACQQELGADEYGDCDVININMYPLPNGYIAHFAAGKLKLTILEQGDGYATQQITLGLAKPTPSLAIESNTGYLPDLSHQWIIWNHLEKLFRSLESIKPSFVVGDVGQYTVETTGTIGACLCLGSSVGTTLGLTLSGLDYPFCVVGDGSFLHSNAPALAEARARGARFGVIIIDNGGSAATGGQPLITNVYAAVEDGIPRHRVNYTETTEAQFADKLQAMKDSDKLAVLFVKLDR